MIQRALRLRMINVNVRIEAKAKKPTAIGWMNLNKRGSIEWSPDRVTKKERPPIRMEAGRIHMIKVSIAKGSRPRLKPIRVSVWVDDAPGNNWQNALKSNNSCSVISLLFSTKVFIIIPICPWGPPNAVRLCKSTARRKGIWRRMVKSGYMI